MQGCLPNTVKYLLFGTNLLVFLMACVVLGFGAFALIDGKTLSHLVSLVDKTSSVNLYATASIMLIVVSLIVIFVTFLGCCGAAKENRCMLGVYFTTILALFIVMIVGGVIGYSQSLEELKGPMLKTITRYEPKANDTATLSLTTAWDSAQKDFKCCGVDSYTDWSTNHNYQQTGGVPASCCYADGITDATTCAAKPASVASMLSGCYTKFQDLLQKNATKILAVAVTIVIIMFINMIFAFALCTMTS